MITADERKLLDSVSIDEPWKLVETFSTWVREHPNDVNRAMDHLVGRLKSFGIPVTVHEPALYLSLPGKARVEAGGKSYRAKPPSFSKPAPQGLSGELVYIPAKRSADIDNVFDMKLDKKVDHSSRVRGKIVISEGFASPGIVSQFQGIGAIGVIAVNHGADIHWGTCASIWGAPELGDLDRKAKIPAVAVNNADGKALIELAKQGSKVTIVAELEEGWFPGNKLPVVEIKGSEEPEKFVLLHGHLDSWDVGVGDNAVGDAALLEIARVLWLHRSQLKRSVRIAWWPGHSTGRYAGSTWFADEFAIDLEENCVAQVDCDSPGCRWASEFIHLDCMPETTAFIADAIRDAAGKSVQTDRASRAGDYSFNNIGISSYYMLSSTMTPEKQKEMGYYDVGGCGGNIAWHTENDTLEIADRDNLLRDIKVYLLSVYRNANARVLPFDWRLAAREFVATIDDYQGKAGNRFDLSPAKREAETLVRRLEAFHDGIETGKVSPASANDVILRLARILVPINFTREARFKHDPALTIPPLPTLSSAGELADLDESQRGFALTQLARGQNRLVSALREASGKVEAATA
ncbi:MAG TPA: M28 family peptidase [Candidatus Polarisedimenticolia bacterium]|nr:M28 family peptidase [Candidatus Polarisedimenticolia bacterium]